MDKNDIIIRNVICNEMRRSNKHTIITQQANIDIEMNEFLKTHIAKIVNSDELKYCKFDKDSYIKLIAEHFREENLIHLNQGIGNRLYQLIIENENILEAELIVLTYQYHSKLYLGMLKMNYKEKYVHRENTAGLKKADTLPICTIQEAVIISLSEQQVFVKEKKVEINGVPTNYFSTMFLQCHTKLSEKEKYYIMNHTLKKINERYETERINKVIELKLELLNQLEVSRKISVQEVLERLYDESEKKEITEQLKKYEIEKELIQIYNTSLLRKIKNIKVVNCAGYEITFPIEEIQSGRIAIQETQTGEKNIVFKKIIMDYCK